MTELEDFRLSTAEKFDALNARVAVLELKFRDAGRGFLFASAAVLLILLFLAVQVRAANSTVAGSGQTLYLNGTDCASILVNDTVVATSCGTNPSEPVTIQHTYGGNLITPVLSSTVYGTTVNSPAFPALNKLVSLQPGEAWTPDDSRYVLNVSCKTSVSTCENTTPSCVLHDVDEELEPGEVFKNETCKIRVKAKDPSPAERVDITTPLATGQSFVLQSKFVTNLNVTCAPGGILYANTTNSSATATPLPTCAEGAYFDQQRQACVSNTAPAAVTAGGGNDGLVLLVAAISGFGTLVLVGIAVWQMARRPTSSSSRSSQPTEHEVKN